MYWPGRLFNFFYGVLVRTTVVPNTAEDKVGKASALFAKVSPLLGQGKTMKKTQPRLYKVVKYSLNTTLLVLFYLLLHGVYQVVSSVV